MRFPLVDPNPPRLSEHLDVLRRVEASGVYSNNGPELRAFEAEATERLFGGRGACLGVANATLGLMLAIRQAIGREGAKGRLALMPAMTFAATAQAAEWCGLTPLIGDIDPESWTLCPAAEERLLERHGDRVAVIVPYATFGTAIDLDRYAWLAERYGVGVVVDAAASLGTIDAAGRGFGSGAPFAIVHSLHATKTFAVAEGGLIHCGDAARIDDMRSMNNFGFAGSRSAVMPGINAKMAEIVAAMARLKLAEIRDVVAGRSAVEAAYRDRLDGVTLQTVAGERRATQFLPALLPPHADRDRVIAALAADGIGCGAYFSPHLGQQPWIRDHALAGPTPVADDVAARIVSLPITDRMTAEDAAWIASRVNAATRAPRIAASPRAMDRLIVVGGGPAGTALLTAAAKQGQLAALAQAGLTIAERDDALGGGRLGRYAISSDSTAETFLSAVKDNPYPEIATLIDHPAARQVAKFVGALGVPLVDAGPLLRVTGDRLAGIVAQNGGRVATGHDVVSAKRVSGGWSVTVRRLSDGREREHRAANLVVATGGYQPLDRLATEEVAGAPLHRLAAGRLMQSDELLALGGLDRAADLLRSKRAPKVAVIGGSTSALASVALMLRSRPGIAFGAGGITLLHRRPLRPFYHSPDAARADSFTDFGDDDICPVSGFVYRLGGFRLEARELVLRMLQVDGRAPEPRVATHRIGDDEARARTIIEQADLVVGALGYRPHALALSDDQGRPLPLAADTGRPMVDRHCRLLDAHDRPIPGAYGIGLAAGFVPWGRLGGEASFRGQANGLWLWQNDVGQMIVDQVLGEAVQAVA
ncbi:MAG: DegT/DnrJ/EryC1/StrS family aminotransferase [Sphingomonas sp.]|uniref:aminotransferase class I/II-fold pyridoxal phosphate-dependent enzyme n=1 Tax=Sphingomonas sp. TaxID=28214 RepID=UPI001AD35218|nr:aminotransferase class I/II-fold pyridoxal phosphate-dependent enzyme [Sphingomonas sp.]MBN8806626.1 DegT/DnrJ/EryC1/StrS family aminotransferase [Sphingomonas sp.]